MLRVRGVFGEGGREGEELLRGDLNQVQTRLKIRLLIMENPVHFIIHTLCRRRLRK